jgi:hypothetical protein
MSNCPPDMQLATYGHLALALGGSADSFTGHLLLLIAKADPGNRARLRAGFPRQVAAWEWWMLSGGDGTAGQMEEALAALDAESTQRRMETEWPDGRG